MLRAFEVLWLPSRRYIVGLAAAATVLVGATCHEDPTEPGKGRVTERWYQGQVDGSLLPRPAVSDAAAYFAAGGGFVIARDLSSGAVKWSTRVGVSQHAASPEIGGENLLLRSGVLIVPVAFHTSGVDAATGTELWRYEAPSDTIDKASPRPGFLELSRIDADENTVYIPAWGATVSAVDIKSGQPRWVWRVEANLSFRSGSSGVRLAGDTLFATVWHSLDRQGLKSEAWLLALDKFTGREFWRVVIPRQSTGVIVGTAPAIWRHLVFVTIISGDLFAVDRATRQVAWHIPGHVPAYGLQTALITGPEVYGDVVYANGSDQKIRAFRASDGGSLWESADVGQLGEDMLVTGKYVYAGTGPELLILDRHTGVRYAALRHPRKPGDGGFSSSVAAHKGQIFVTLRDGAWSFDEP